MKQSTSKTSKMARGSKPLWVYPRNWVMDKYSDVRVRVVSDVKLEFIGEEKEKGDGGIIVQRRNAE